jgi:outer membrane protein assembly factor BamB
VDPTFEWTVSSSPVIYENLVILQLDLLKGGSYVAAFDISSGKDVWRVERDEIPSWSTPLVFRGPSRTELITLGSNFARSYDPKTGKELWRLGRHSSLAAPMPIAGGGLIFFTSGAGGTVQPIYAVRPGATGDVTLNEGQASNEVVVWSKSRGGAFIPTPVFYRDLLYVSSTNGILAVYHPETGERLYQQRLTNGGSFSASGVAGDGKLYYASEDGEVIVVRAGSTFERLAVNPVGELIIATPAIHSGTLFIRSQNHVIAVAEGGNSE